jgi:hypothetical protein
MFTKARGFERFAVFIDVGDVGCEVEDEQCPVIGYRVCRTTERSGVNSLMAPVGCLRSTRLEQRLLTDSSGGLAHGNLRRQTRKTEDKQKWDSHWCWFYHF